MSWREGLREREGGKKSRSKTETERPPGKKGGAPGVTWRHLGRLPGEGGFLEEPMVG